MTQLVSWPIFSLIQKGYRLLPDQSNYLAVEPTVRCQMGGNATEQTFLLWNSPTGFDVLHQFLDLLKQGKQFSFIFSTFFLDLIFDTMDRVID